MSPRPRGPPDRAPPEFPPADPADVSAGARWGEEPGAVASGGLEGEPLVGSVVIGDRERRGAARRIAPKSEQSGQRTAPPNRWAATLCDLRPIADCGQPFGSIARRWPFDLDLRASPRSRGICRGCPVVWNAEGPPESDSQPEALVKDEVGLAKVDSKDGASSADESGVPIPIVGGRARRAARRPTIAARSALIGLRRPAPVPSGSSSLWDRLSYSATPARAGVGPPGPRCHGDPETIHLLLPRFPRCACATGVPRDAGERA